MFYLFPGLDYSSLFKDIRQLELIFFFLVSTRTYNLYVHGSFASANSVYVFCVEGGEEGGGGGVANRQAKKVSPAEQSMVYELLIP